MDTIALFPLSTVLLPGGRMRLQIFEPRYLDLVSRCLKGEQQGFGVVWLRQGKEVYKQETDADNRLSQVGTMARIVDWDSLPNGLLGITIEGDKKFRLVSSFQQPDHLNMAEVEWVAAEPQIALPEQSDELTALLSQLLQHPHLARMELSAEVADVSTLSFLLTQLLPFPEETKFQLLAMSDPVARLQCVTELLDEFSQ